MRWMIAGLVALALLAALAYAALVPPTGGPGWRLDPDATWGRPVVPDSLDPTVVIYAADESSIGLGITIYGSSSCPPRIRGVDLRDGAVSVRASRDIAWIATGCTADAAPHSFGILVDRSRLGSAPISVTVTAEDDGFTSTTTLEELP